MSSTSGGAFTALLPLPHQGAAVSLNPRSSPYWEGGKPGLSATASVRLPVCMLIDGPHKGIDRAEQFVNRLTHGTEWVSTVQMQ